MILDWEKPKDPDDIEKYSLNWAPEMDVDETILTSTWSSDSEDLSVESSGISGQMTTVFLSGGVAGTTYLVTNRITTSATPRQLDQSCRLRVVNN